ncbi:uncharacterized protein LOC132743952 [Ruditapes philippinarum]|uniref:uncharacterized protein LOC132743952 n=1 Tax=Ruditapes philippinarum TaxID=129788 RepID=UPI00295BB9E2|nr:uncharacterized protein LOC132743952 [Ruditapes philippinarum]
MAYTCEQCGASFTKLSQLLRHRRTENHWQKFTCPSCKKSFNRKQNLDRHMKKHADENTHHCPECLKVFTRKDALDEHFSQHENQSGGGMKRTHGDNEHNSTGKRQKLTPKDNASEYYKMEKINERRIEKFNTTASYYKIKIKDLEVRDLQNILKTLKVIFQSILSTITENIPANDLVRVSMDNPELDYPIVLRFMPRSALTVDRLLSEIERVLQSYEQFVVDETFGIELVHVSNVTGSGYRMKPTVDITQMLQNKKSVIQIKNKDELCLARALVTAVARVEKHPQWDNIRRGRQIQQDLAIELHQKADVPLGKCGIEEVKKFQATILNYQIHVVSKAHFNAIIYQGPEGGVPIYIYNHDDHYDVITSMTGFLNRNFFCQKCKKGYQTEERHRCNNPCHYCRKLHEDVSEDWQFCETCNCKFVNQTCFDLHNKKTEKGKSTCELYYRCKHCSQLINCSKHKHDHICGEKYCDTCKDFVSENHLCYMQPVEDDDTPAENDIKKEKQTKYIFFDLECTQDKRLECPAGYLPGVNNTCVNCKKSWCGSMEHRANLCVAHRVCSACMHLEVTSSSKCSQCGPNEWVFSGSNTIESFCKWLFTVENKGATVLCHNFKGYDSYPIMNFLYDNAILPEVITTGSKYMSIVVPIFQIRFIDSLNFIPMALANMPKAFGETELAKGYFPHLFNTTENYSVELDHLPDIKYYNPDSMKPESRQKFLEWYGINRHTPFSLQTELLRYCQSDVDILRKCCLKFRTLFKELTQTSDNDGIDPFEKCITIASACNLVFRSIFLNHETIGIIPSHGYRPEAKQSIMAYQWLSYLAFERQIYIQHGRNKGEKQIGPYKVDGYYETAEGQKVVLEFHGDFWHGCPKCFSKSTINRVNGLSMSELYTNTLDKQKYLESAGYIYECIWECDFRKKLESNPIMKKYIESLEIVPPLEPRDAFHGGRTEAFKMYAESTADTHIKYFDVTSLYPFINKTGKVPLGHPNIITENFENLSNYEGLIKCKILPPRKLYIPVLPTKCNGKLMFSLCRTCSETYENGKCQHDDNERAITGTWVTDEVKMALSQGYRLLNVYEVWHFDEMAQYDPHTKTGGLFTEYVNTFLKVKQEASGWPDWCKTETDRHKYIQEYFDKEGILLDYDKIEENPGLRLLAKIILNSFWGKFGQRSNLTQTTFIDDPVQFIDMMTSDQQEIKNVRFINDEAVQLDWAYNTDFIETSGRTNVVVAAYTTAQARLKLYSYLQALGDRVLYCDTDSVVFTSSQGQWEPALGDFLGDLTDEVPNNQITKFVTGGPKNYAYCLEKPNKKGQSSICKVRGITLNFKNSLDINFDTLKDMVTGQMQNQCVKVVDINKIVRNREMCHIITKTEIKDYKIVFDKRVISENYNSFPYGY